MFINRFFKYIYCFFIMKTLNGLNISESKKINEIIKKKYGKHIIYMMI